MSKDKTIFGIAVGFVTLVIGVGIKKVYDNYFFNEDGFNNNGYNHKGFDRNGFDKKRLDSGGYDANGFNMQGYDREGYNSRGYNFSGYDRNNRNQLGYDKNGYDINGYDRNGYNSDGYNLSEIDCSGYGREYYTKKLLEMSHLLKSSHSQMKAGKFPYALRDIRVGLEKGVKCIIEHKKGSKRCAENLYKNIDICSRYALLDEDFIQKLHNAKNHCNDTQQ